ncbi:hypothetical protein [Oceaniradius stylonematis]|uniref:hypothetical protein n=1 Tax=Oceaniradius stylonematis TaxID=2184161 RepID=UPI00273E292A|nr:hypothetical protein [Oceaniradius stylonematis]
MKSMLKKIRTVTASTVLLLGLAATPEYASAHQVWCHSGCQDTLRTVEFFHKSKDVYVALTKVERIWQEASYSLENGILAEFDSKVDSSKSLRIDEYQIALNGYIEMGSAMDELAKAISVLQEVDANCEKVEEFALALERNLSEADNFPRVGTAGVRYSDAAGLAEEGISSMSSITDILGAWQSDLKVMSETLDEVIVAMQDAMPLTERGQFAAVMLSGRNAFGEKMPQFTNMFSAYQRLYVTTVLATIATTMQVYPNGYEWLAAN